MSNYPLKLRVMTKEYFFLMYEENKQIKPEQNTKNKYGTG